MSQTVTWYDQDMAILKDMKVDFEILDMTLEHTGEIIATDYSNRRVVRIAQSGDISTVCSTAPRGAWGVCVNNRQQIVVGQYRPVRLVVYSPDGSHVDQEIAKDDNSESFFTHAVLQVKQRRNGDYVVLGPDKIVCVTTEGEFKWIYDWYKGMECKGVMTGLFDEFPDFFGLVCDMNNNVIIADCNNDHVLLLDNEGRLVRTLLTKKDGINYPRYLSIDQHGCLWIGQTDNVKVVKYVK